MHHQPNQNGVFIGPKDFNNKIKILNSQNFKVQAVLLPTLCDITNVIFNTTIVLDSKGTIVIIFKFWMLLLSDTTTMGVLPSPHCKSWKNINSICQLT